MAPASIAASVVVPTHEGAHRLPVLLDALAAQDTDEPWEVVVVVDRSTDGTRGLLDAYRDRLPLVVLDSPPPHGVVAALNTGYDAARGRVVIRCDDDLTPGPHMVRRHLELHRDRDDLGVSCVMRDVVPDTPYGRAYGRRASERRMRAWYERPAHLRWVDWSAHNSVTRAGLDRLDHGYDPRFEYGEDSELAYRLARAGIEIVVDPDLEIEHRGAPLSAANRVPRAYVAGASRRLFEQVHGVSHDTGDSRARSGRQRVWAGATTTSASMLRRWRHYERLGRAVEALLPRVPPVVGRRLVAFAVESAGRAGRRHGPTDLHGYRGQKARETARERDGSGRPDPTPTP